MRNLIFIIAIFFIGIVVPTDAAITQNNSCVDCHKSISPFTEQQSRLNEIRLNHTARNISCSLECHEDVLRKLAADNFQQWSDSAHSKYFVTCDACHGGNPDMKNEAEAHASMKNKDDPNSTIYFKNIPDTCGKCHSDETEHFKNTMHYQRLKAESRAPSCATCHQPHTFKVLKASELIAVCSVCHNPREQIAVSSVPDDATHALSKQKDLQDEYLKAINSVEQAKEAGKDISSAQMDIDRSKGVIDNIPSLWHGFNLKDFDTQIQIGIDSAKKAEYKMSGVEPTVPRTSFVGIVLVLGILAIIYLFRKQ
ncbi:MAG: hypothetical protein J5U17_05840 [Candidatus Methanoperedens sp.]|nr:hypothetical protein [Candidatus Methanoperedens sp.]MCE8425282.1 hypothetical protein [Candidatus Methanoperedens sp.]MCE8427803.1 hypothetical protein [Candidatus Methanoperedens sp.]